jgi:hypothetical protein
MEAPPLAPNNVVELVPSPSSSFLVSRASRQLVDMLPTAGWLAARLGRAQLRGLGSGFSALQIAPVPPAISVVVRPMVSEGKGRGFLGPFPRASPPTSTAPAPVSPADLKRRVRNHRFHSCHAGRQRSCMKRCGVAGHQGSGECAHEGHFEGMHVFLPHLVSNGSEKGCSGRTTTVRRSGS